MRRFWPLDTICNTEGLHVPLHRKKSAGKRRVTVAILGVAASAITVLATTSTPVLASGSDQLAKHPTRVPAGAVRSDISPETLGSHGPKFSSSQFSTRVVGGTTANSTDFPGVVGIRNYYWLYNPDTEGYDQYISTCTGTVISPTKILTAAHCTTDYPEGDIQVIAGRNKLSDTTSGTVYGVSNVWVPQTYNIAAQYDNPSTTAPLDDVAVLTLKTPVDPAYAPYNLVGQGDQTPYAAGTDAVIAGYGITSNDDGALPGVLYKATIQTQSDSTCTSTASSLGASYDSSRMICAGVAPTTTGGTDGIDTCRGDSGGPLFVNGVEAAITDWGSETCGSSYGFYERMSYYNTAIGKDVSRTNMPVNLDFSGDGHSDLLFRSPDGSLGEISGAGFVINSSAYGNLGGISDWKPLDSTGWGGFKKLFRVTNWNGDHTESIFAMTSTGLLYQYKTDGAGKFVGSKVQIGSGWTMFNDIMVTNNWLGDGRPNLIGRTPTGDLILYTSNGTGGWTNSHGTKIGSGWGSFNTIITPGNWRGLGQALIGRTSTGDLRLYESNGAGGWLNTKGTLIGTGWNGLPTFLSPGDWNGDNLIDLIGVASNGNMTLYRTDGSGHWLNGHGDPMTTGFWLDNGPNSDSGDWSGLYIF
jgi:hypothetical protein